jgi:hypothetical protein
LSEEAAPAMALPLLLCISVTLSLSGQAFSYVFILFLSLCKFFSPSLVSQMLANSGKTEISRFDIPCSSIILYSTSLASITRNPRVV